MRRALPVRRLSVVMCALVIVVVAGVLPAGAQTAKTPAPIIDPRPIVTASAVPSRRGRVLRHRRLLSGRR